MEYGNMSIAFDCDDCGPIELCPMDTESCTTRTYTCMLYDGDTKLRTAYIEARSEEEAAAMFKTHVKRYVSSLTHIVCDINDSYYYVLQKLLIMIGFIDYNVESEEFRKFLKKGWIRYGNMVYDYRSHDVLKIYNWKDFVSDMCNLEDVEPKYQFFYSHIDRFLVDKYKKKTVVYVRLVESENMRNVSGSKVPDIQYCIDKFRWNGKNAQKMWKSVLETQC